MSAKNGLQDWLQVGVLQLKMRCIIGCADPERCGAAQRNAFLNTFLALRVSVLQRLHRGLTYERQAESQAGAGFLAFHTDRQRQV